MYAVAQNVVVPGLEPAREDGFPFAPAGWSRAEAEAMARIEGLQLTEMHWEVLCALQEYHARHEDLGYIQPREWLDALEERFHPEGGVKFLYQLFPRGPLAQGCRLAGLEPPPGARDHGFGSVM